MRLQCFLYLNSKFVAGEIIHHVGHLPCMQVHASWFDSQHWMWSTVYHKEWNFECRGRSKSNQVKAIQNMKIGCRYNTGDKTLAFQVSDPSQIFSTRIWLPKHCQQWPQGTEPVKTLNITECSTIIKQKNSKGKNITYVFGDLKMIAI